jgi:CRP-like cAMP-binding protein
MTQRRWSSNRLLLALPSFHLERLVSDLETVNCRSGQVLVDLDAPIEDIFFPEAGLISVAAVYDKGKIGEVTIIGREGCTGVEAVLGADRSSVRLQVEISGPAVRMPLQGFIAAMNAVPAFRSTMNGYVRAYMEQLMLSVACLKMHNLNQRLARWLLTIRDGADGDELRISQQQLASLLGVHRPSITNAAHDLERMGLIMRGVRQVTVVDRVALAKAACECYRQLQGRQKRGRPQLRQHGEAV